MPECFGVSTAVNYSVYQNNKVPPAFHLHKKSCKFFLNIEANANS